MCQKCQKVFEEKEKEGQCLCNLHGCLKEGKEGEKEREVSLMSEILKFLMLKKLLEKERDAHIKLAKDHGLI